MQYYLMIGGQRRGPFPKEQLPAQGLQRDTLVWAQGMANWLRADQAPELSDLIAATPPPPPIAAVPVEAPRAARPTAASPPRRYQDDYASRSPARSSPQTRYDPGTFGRLYISFLVLYLAFFVIALLGVVLLIIAGNMETYTKEVLPRSERKGYDPNAPKPLLDLDMFPEYKPDYAAQQRQRNLVTVGLMTLGMSFLAATAAGLLLLLFLYKSWNQIQDPQAQTSPGQAVGFLLIPFYNLYWIFVAYKGLATNMNAYANRHGIDMPPVSGGLGTACCMAMLAWPVLSFFGLVGTLIYSLATMPPLFGERRRGMDSNLILYGFEFVALIVVFLFLFLFLNSVKNGSAAIARWKLRQAAA